MAEEVGSLREEMKEEIQEERRITNRAMQVVEERLAYLEGQTTRSLQQDQMWLTRYQGLEERMEKGEIYFHQLRQDSKSAAEEKAELRGRIDELERAAERREGDIKAPLFTARNLWRRLVVLVLVLCIAYRTWETWEKQGEVKDLQAKVRFLWRQHSMQALGLSEFTHKVPKGEDWDFSDTGAEVGGIEMEAIVAGVNLTGVEEVYFRHNKLTPSALPPLFHLLREPHAQGVTALSLFNNPSLLTEAARVREVFGRKGGGGLPHTLTGWLSLGRCGLTPDSLRALLEPGILPPGLKILYIWENPGLLGEVSMMEALGARQGGLPTALKRLIVSRSGATEDGITALRKLRPELTIES